MPDRYGLVSSLYGPGAIACWYLTTLSIVVSWTLHPKKRKTGSIDVDLIALLTLPAVAAGHVISQALTLLSDYDMSASSDIGGDQYDQSIAAIEAPFSIIETFMIISVILFLIAVWALCLRRAICVAVVGLLCLATECYINLSRFHDLGIQYQRSGTENDKIPAFSRSFVADFSGLVIAIILLLAIFAIGASAIITYILRSRRSSQESGGTSRPTREQNLPRALQMGARGTRTSGGISMVFAFAIMTLTIIPSAMNSIQFSYAILRASGYTSTIWPRLKIFAAHFYPRSSNSFSDLDQAVATAAGATVLGFNMYSTVKARYAMQSIGQLAQDGSNRIELEQLDQNGTV
ncbi:hypothetical protein LTR84_005414 [Exophiala bonariae]|uniref:Uncharacterized protein n=1 Tax=Exophiala bonariae TaxID=1690606 RepID=A0AAV9N746_9EURO|nr:hypothetical protein LTR84_005414 [Exophiala bonariae]